MEFHVKHSVAWIRIRGLCTYSEERISHWIYSGIGQQCQRIHTTQPCSRHEWNLFHYRTKPSTQIFTLLYWPWWNLDGILLRFLCHSFAIVSALPSHKQEKLHPGLSWKLVGFNISTGNSLRSNSLIWVVTVVHCTRENNLVQSQQNVESCTLIKV